MLLEWNMLCKYLLYNSIPIVTLSGECGNSFPVLLSNNIGGDKVIQFQTCFKHDWTGQYISLHFDIGQYLLLFCIILNVCI